MANATKVQIVGEDGYAVKVNSAGALEVDATLTPSGTQDVNLTQVGGAAVTAGAGAVAAGTLRATLASNDPAVVALQIMDDWDESDRAKVNPIVGQAGIAAGTGGDGPTVPRVSLATDVPLPAGTNNIGDVDVLTLPSQAYSASATFTPAAASHTAGDVNGTAQQFSSIGPSGGRIMITTATIEIDGGTAEATAWRLYLFNVTPPSALADDDPFVLASGDRASYLGYVELGTAADIGDTQWNEFSNINKQLLLSSANLFGYLVNLSTLTPAAVAHIVTLHAIAV